MIKLNLENICYGSGRKSLPNNLISKNIKSKVHRAEMLYEYEIFKSHGKGRALRRICEPRWKQE
jgi:hypothetical protein